FPERAEALLGGRVLAVVESVGVERGAEHFDLGFRRGALSGADVLENVRGDERGEDRDHDDHDENFDQRESGAKRGSASRKRTKRVAARGGHRTWVGGLSELRSAALSGARGTRWTVGHGTRRNGFHRAT